MLSILYHSFYFYRQRKSIFIKIYFHIKMDFWIQTDRRIERNWNSILSLKSKIYSQEWIEAYKIIFILCHNVFCNLPLIQINIQQTIVLSSIIYFMIVFSNNGITNNHQTVFYNWDIVVDTIKCLCVAITCDKTKI